MVRVTDSSPLRDRLAHEILMARERVYAVGRPTPLERIELPLAAEVHLKREDLSPIHAFKWRGAYNRMALLGPEERDRGVICASAGNHAQGVALAASRLGVSAVIFMPLSTPRMKRIEVNRLGGEQVEVILHGDDYSASAERALAVAREEGRVFIHAYDDLAVMGGQGTLADEVVMSGQGPFEVAYLQIGGGGMAAAVACWLRQYYPRILIVGVEGEGQASMSAAVRAGAPVALDYVDVFSDGTAVRTAGEQTFELCRDLIDEFITVANDELCAAIQLHWEALRFVPEPAGAMGIAGLVKDAHRAGDKRVLCVCCGANMDFGQLAMIARHAGIGAARRRYLRFKLEERSGSLFSLIDTILEGVNIIEFQYGKVHESEAWPVIGFEASPPELDLLDRRLSESGVAHEDVTGSEDVEFRIIHYEPALFRMPIFIKLEFPERAGALHDFLERLHPMASICYFNYVYSGETVGRALLGFEFESPENRALFEREIEATGRSYRQIDPAVLDRIL